MRFLVGTIRAVEWLNERVGRVVSWLVLATVLLTFAVAILRYGVSFGRVWAQELYVWTHATVFMVAAGYTLLHEGHVRVDIFYQNARARTKAWINLFGTLFLLFPTIGLLSYVILPYVLLSWHRFEGSQEAGGMPGLFLLKSMMLLYCFFLVIQGIALIFRSILILLNHPEFQVEPDEIEGV